MLGLAPLTREEIIEVFPEESFERDVFLEMEGFWDDAVAIIK